MGSVYKVDWSHKCLSPGANPSNSIDTLGAGQDGCVLLCEGQPDPLQVLPGKHLQAASAPAGVSQTKIDLTSDHFQWMRNPDTLQELVEEKVGEDENMKGFTLKLPRTVAR